MVILSLALLEPLWGGKGLTNGKVLVTGGTTLVRAALNSAELY